MMSKQTLTTAAYPFKHSRSVQPADNTDLYVSSFIKKQFLSDDFTPSHDVLNRMDEGYDIGDPLCDAWLAEAEALNLPAHGMIMFKQALEQGIESVADAPKTLKAMFEHANATPDWVDNDLIYTGSKALERYPIMQSLMLQSVSLMGGYSVPGLAQPLLETGALSRSVVPRIARTLGFLAAVTIPHGLNFREIGYKQALHVRTVHGLVRAQLMKPESKWDFERFGTPISQTDLIATNMQFSLTVIHGLLAFNCVITERERAGVLHLWRYVAHLLGIDDALMPKTEMESNEWLYSYMVTQKMDAKAARPLAVSLHKLPSEIEARFKQKAVFEQALRASVTRFFWGDDIADDLGLPNVLAARLAMRAMMATQFVTDRLQSNIKPLAWSMDISAEQYRNHVRSQYLAVKPDLKPLFDEIEETYNRLNKKSAA